MLPSPEAASLGIFLSVSQPHLRASLGHIQIFGALSTWHEIWKRGALASTPPSAGVCGVTRVNCEGWEAALGYSPYTQFEAFQSPPPPFLFSINRTSCTFAICREHPVAGFGCGSLLLEHLSPDQTLTHGITLSGSFSLWGPLLPTRKLGMIILAYTGGLFVI